MRGTEPWTPELDSDAIIIGSVMLVLDMIVLDMIFLPSSMSCSVAQQLRGSDYLSLFIRL